MKKIAVACGDPSGIGPELIEQCLLEHRIEDAEYYVFGTKSWLAEIEAKSPNRVVGVPLGDYEFVPGQPEPAGAKLAIAAMEAAANSCSEGDCDAVVTGPISKELCAKVGYRFPGQTEFFADKWGGQPTMAFVGRHFRVCLATWHIPVQEVPAALTRAAFEKSIRSAEELGKRLGMQVPRLMVCGLNPHAGEGGILGTEEKTFLNPWLEELQGELDAALIGCVPGDTAFLRALKGEADVVVAMYHDQGLAPFKAVDFDSGVNVTLGLKHLRVSPDHGTGFDIAGTGKASAGSMRHAFKLASQLG